MSDDIKKYIWVDADTIVVKSCMSVQTNTCVYLNGEFVEPAASKKQWIKDNPKKNPDKYEFRKGARIVQRYNNPKLNLSTLLSTCKKQIKDAIAHIQSKYPDRELWIVLEGEGNYREEHYPAYKQNRTGEILLRKQLSKWVGEFFPRVVYAVGIETDDIICQRAWQGYKDKLATGVYTHMIASSDKDLTTCPCLIYNYGKDTEREITPLEATRFFCYQILMGDNVDNVSGLNGAISKELCNELGVRYNSKGMGSVTANNILTRATTEKECFELVIKCYKDVWHDKWMDRMQEEAFVLRMQRVKDEMYSLKKHLYHLRIEYD